MSCLGNYIEYVVSSTNATLGPSSTLGDAEGSANAFNILMSAARSRSATPDKKLCGGTNKDRLKNDMIDFLVKNKLGWDPAHANSVGSAFVNSVCD